MIFRQGWLSCMSIDIISCHFMPCRSEGWTFDPPFFHRHWSRLQMKKHEPIHNGLCLRTVWKWCKFVWHVNTGTGFSQRAPWSFLTGTFDSLAMAMLVIENAWTPSLPIWCTYIQVANYIKLSNHWVKINYIVDNICSSYSRYTPLKLLSPLYPHVPCENDVKLKVKSIGRQTWHPT